MTKDEDQSATFSDDETARRRDDALRRALNTPPQPHVTMSKPSSVKATRASKKHATAGKPAPSA